MNLPARARLISLACFSLLAVLEPSILSGQLILRASDGTPWDLFGFSVAMSGDTVVIGAPLQDNPGEPDSGAAYVFVRNGTSWSEQARLAASDAEWARFFGTRVAISGDTAVVGGLGTTYVFVRSGSTWSEQAKLLPAGGLPTGDAIAISADTVVTTDSSNGFVFVFVRNGASWSEQARFSALDPPPPPTDSFGTALAISGDTLLIGASGTDDDKGAVYVFERNGTTWSQQAKLVAAGGEPGDRFGIFVALSGDTVAIWTAGAVSIFERNGSTWSPTAQLLASNGQSLGAIALDGDMLIAGAPAAEPESAHVFLRRGSAWLEHRVLHASEEDLSEFGNSVALSGTTALVGTMIPVEPGAAYLFALEGVGVAPATGLFTFEDGPPAVFTATLNTEPAGDVVIDLASTDADEAAVSPSRLTFTPDDWWTPQTITLSGVEDLDPDNGKPCSVLLTMNTELTGDTAYDGVDPPDVSAVSFEFSGDFFTVVPCRVLDTRLDQEPLSDGVKRTVAIHDACGVPATARAVALTVTVVEPTGSGQLVLDPGDLPWAPGLTPVAFAAGRNQAQHVIPLLDLAGTGMLTVSPLIAGGGTAHLVLDVGGYFE